MSTPKPTDSTDREFLENAMIQTAYLQLLFELDRVFLQQDVVTRAEYNMLKRRVERLLLQKTKNLGKRNDAGD